MNLETDAGKNTEVGSGVLPVTHWSLLAQGVSGSGKEGTAALEELCRKYWRPVYFFVSRRVVNHHQAEDLTQGFFAFLIEKQALKRVDATKGRFRTFLLAALTNFLANEHDKEHALKRGGHLRVISLDETTTEGFFHVEPAAKLDPEKSFDRCWALSTLENTLTRLKAHQTKEGKDVLYARLEPALTGAPQSGWYAEAASALGMTENSVRVALHRLRRQFGELLRSEIEQTVTGKEAVDEEIRHLFAAISN